MTFADPGAANCSSCRTILTAKAVRTLESRAQEVPAHTPYQYLNQQQLIDMLWAVIEEKNGLQLKLLNLSRQVGRTARCMTDFKRFLMALATHDIPRLHYLIRIAVKQGVSVEEIIWRVEEAAKHLYSAKSFTETERKFMRAIKRLQSSLCAL
ncbi:hypothetical protein K438DRAFT_1635851 [Mycena galopus ATCC 62051]|nr:hypothetical protein K438DRAFT_1635851 [Mycena galopus ATCC 62051]